MNDAKIASFDEFWSAYPRKVGKGIARQKFEKALKVADAESIMAGLERYKDKIARERIEEKFVVHPSTWLHQERWEDQYQPKDAECKLDAHKIMFWQEKYRKDPALVPRDMRKLLRLGEFST